ncbi:MAG: hypothetical protein K2K37_01750 [Muribaculaceae bacterium]|nr:hypothetical protein [Muribaculaceae bacterium]
MVETHYFAISPQQYVRAASSVWLTRYSWIGLAAVIVTVMAGMYDARFFIVGAALLLVAYPGILMIVYFNHALTREAAYGVIRHKATLTDSGIDIEYVPEDDHPTPPARHIGKEDIAKTEDTGHGMKITLTNGRYDIILIPADAFGEGDFAKAMDLLSKNV